MKKHFYTHLIEIESVLIELDKMELDDHQRRHLASLIDANLHNAILDTILAHLSEHDKNIFLKHLTENDHERIWQHLNIKIESIEDKIKKTADDFRKELHEDIKISKNLNRKTQN